MDDQEINTLRHQTVAPAFVGRSGHRARGDPTSGADAPAVMNWVTAHDGVPETTVAATRQRGLHGSHFADGAPSRPPARFVLPVGALD